MNIDMLAANTVKITMDSEEMSAYNISCDDISKNTRESKLALSRFISEIKEENKLVLPFDRMLIEAFPRKNGGCVLYLSCLKRAVKNGEKQFFFRSESLSDIARLCRALSGFEGVRASLYLNACNEECAYRLAVACDSDNPRIKQIASEFAVFEGSSDILLPDTEEYYSLICPDALHFLPKVF